MVSLENLSAKLVRSENSDSEFVLFTHYTPEKLLTIKVLNVGAFIAYSGQITDINLRSMSAEVRMQYETYLQETLRAFSGDIKDPMFTFFLEEKGDDLHFKWKKILDSDCTKVCLGHVELARQSFKDTIEDSFVTFCNCVSKLRCNVDMLQDNLKLAEKEKAKAYSLLDEAISVKEQIEMEMYSKFVIVLNNKKRKIRDLEGTLEHAKSETGQKAKTKDSQKKRKSTESNDISVAGPSGLSLRKNCDNCLCFSDEDEVHAPPVKLCKPRSRIITRPRTVIDKSNQVSSKAKSGRTMQVFDHSDDEDCDDLLDEL